MGCSVWDSLNLEGDVFSECLGLAHIKVAKSVFAAEIQTVTTLAAKACAVVGYVR